MRKIIILLALLLFVSPAMAQGQAKTGADPTENKMNSMVKFGIAIQVPLIGGGEF